jgi:ferredoxin-NADP reductase
MNMETPTTLHSLASRLFLDRHLDFWLREANSTFALRELRARISGIVSETHDTKSFLLHPTLRWAGYTAGQYLTLEAEIDGVRYRRCYSISSAPADGPELTITVKRVAGGRVSGWLHERARVGDVVTIGRAGGDFVLPDALPGKLLFVSGGSGITPVLSLILDLAARRRLTDVVLLHYAPAPSEVIFRERLVALAERHPGLRLALRYTRAGGARERFSEETLRELVPDFADRDTFLCGPPALMEEVERLWKRHGIAARLRRERFVPPSAAVSVDASGHRISLAASGRSFETDGRGTLLEQAERAGANPAYGCRMGVCHTCQCRKRSGAIQNLLTGEISSEPDEDIQLCISVPRSDVELNL